MGMNAYVFGLGLDDGQGSPGAVGHLVGLPGDMMLIRMAIMLLIKMMVRMKITAESPIRDYSHT